MGILVLGILEFPTMSSPSLTGGSLYRILEFPKIRHSEALKKAEAISFIKSCLLSLERDCFGRFAPSQ